MGSGTGWRADRPLFTYAPNTDHGTIMVRAEPGSSAKVSQPSGARALRLQQSGGF